MTKREGVVTAVNVVDAEASDKITRVVSELDASAADQLRASFNALFEPASEWIKRAKEIEVTSCDQKREMKLARESRLALKEIRVNADKTRKRLKEDSLRYGRAIDGMYNVLKALVEPIESYLLEQETFAEREEEKKKETLRMERARVLDSYGTDASIYADLGDLSDEQWVIVAETARASRDARVETERLATLAREEADKRAIEEREALSKRVAAQEAENARLRAEAKKKEARWKETERELEAEKKKSAERSREIERAEAERVRAEAERLQREEALLMAPDREKLRAFADALRAVPVPAMTTRQGRMVQKKLATGMTEMIAWVEKVSEELK